MKRKGNNKRPDGSRPLNDRANIVNKIFGRFKEAARERMKEDMGVKILRTLPYVLFFYFVEKGSWLYRHCRGNTAVEKAITMLMNFQYAFRSPLPSLHPVDMAAGFAGAAALYAFLLYRKNNAKKFRQGEEYGSARWGTPKDIAPFIDPVFENNILLTKTERLTMSSRPKNPKYARNKNVIVIGGSGSGKTRGYVKPNLMQCESSTYPVSFVVTDPKGTVLDEVGALLVRRGEYVIKTLNTINFRKSMRYNPFHYIRSEKDILKLVNTIMVNTKGEGEKSSEDFWTSATRSPFGKKVAGSQPCAVLLTDNLTGGMTG